MTALHPHCCAFCGARSDLVNVVLATTGEKGWRCRDLLACIRRNRKHRDLADEGKLFMRTVKRPAAA